MLSSCLSPTRSEQGGRFQRRNPVLHVLLLAQRRAPGDRCPGTVRALDLFFYAPPSRSPFRYNRNWRYHKEMRIWITKETGTPSSQKVPGGEQGTYSYWDAENWEKARKELTVLYADLEEKSQPVYAPGVALQQTSQAPQPQQQQPIVPTGRQFQAMGVAAM
jgi:hypothetical protein